MEDSEGEGLEAVCQRQEGGQGPGGSGLGFGGRAGLDAAWKQGEQEQR